MTSSIMKTIQEDTSDTRTHKPLSQQNKLTLF